MAEPKLAFGLPQHPDEHRPERPILLAVDQQLGEGARFGFPQNSPIRSARSHGVNPESRGELQVAIISAMA